MKESFLAHLVSGNAPWDVEVFEVRDREIWTGVISQNGLAKYPVIRGIPRLLSGYFLDRCLLENREYARKYSELFVSAESNVSFKRDPDLQLKAKTVESFGYEWKSFGKMLPVYERNHRMYFHPYGSQLFRDKLTKACSALPLLWN